MQVFDVRGALVTTLADAPFGAGRHELRWNGRDDRGAAQSPGIYFYRLESDRTSLTRKLVLTQ